MLSSSRCLPIGATTVQPVQLVNPNLHVILIHFPIALLIAGTLIEVFAWLWRRSGFLAAGRWMLLIGGLAMIPSATAGMYAARQAMTHPFEEMKWVELK